MKKVVQLIDSTQYIDTNCFQHQLRDGLQRVCQPDLVSLTEALTTGIPDADLVVSCLRLRTLDRELGSLSRALRGRSVVVYDQDPWEAFKPGAPCNGAYSRVADALNVSFFATTTYAWEARLGRLGFRARHVRMGMLPKYCDAGPGWHERDIDVGFVGQVHPYRAELFDALKAADVNVQVITGGDYAKYLSALSRIKVFVHREAGTYDVNGETIQYAEGLWAKDVEACARGCVSVRNFHPDAYQHMPEALLMAAGLRMFDDESVAEAVNVIRGALAEHDSSPQAFVDDRAWCSRAIAEADEWHTTACILTDEHCDDLNVEEG